LWVRVAERRTAADGTAGAPEAACSAVIDVVTTVLDRPGAIAARGAVSDNRVPEHHDAWAVAGLTTSGCPAVVDGIPGEGAADQVDCAAAVGDCGAIAGEGIAAGGAIYDDGGTVTVTNSIFAGNNAGRGGALYICRCR